MTALDRADTANARLEKLYEPWLAPWREDWVTYHPAYLRRSRQGAVLDMMAESIRQGLA